ELGGGVIRLAEVADQARGRSEMHEGARLLLAEVRRRRARDVEGAEQMNLEHQIPVNHAHAMEDAVAQDAGDVDDAVDAPERVDRGFHDVGGRPGLGDAVEIRNRLPAIALDLVHHLLRRRIRRALAVDRAAEIVDHHLGAFARRRERDLAADAAPGPGDDDDFSLEGLTHRISSPTPPLRGLWEIRIAAWQGQRAQRSPDERSEIREYRPRISLRSCGLQTIRYSLFALTIARMPIDYAALRSWPFPDVEQRYT